MVTEGQLEVLGFNDVLTLALGTPEHSGRVRGLPSGVTPTQFFKTPRVGKIMSNKMKLSVGWSKIFDNQSRKRKKYKKK